MPFFSIITPIYNTEKYLKECLDSLINQSFKNIEIILVNDGSTDNSGEIAREYAKNDKRIKFIEQKNQGQSIARNNALAVANGEYIVFVDSDDYIALNMCEKLFNILKDNPVDVLLADHFTVTEDRKVLRFKNLFYILQTLRPNSNLSSQEAIEILAKYFEKHDLFITTLTHFIIRKNLIQENNISFTPSLLYEDVLFCTTTFLNAKSLYNSSICGYYYYLSPNSTMRGKYDLNKLIKSANSYYYIAKQLQLLSKTEKNQYKKLLLEKGSKTAVHKLLKPLRKIKNYNSVNFTSQDLFELKHLYTIPTQINIKNPNTYRFIHPFVIASRYIKWVCFLPYRAARKSYVILFNHRPNL